MRRILKYLVIFIWVTVFFCFFNMFMPRNLLYFLIGLPVSMFGTFFITIFLEKETFSGFVSNH
ncbi:putative membrane-anchored protein [Peribacillus sp. V2I11]|nr:putative membrane-anchored protein [Peribacillus sp. V2I11]